MCIVQPLASLALALSTCMFLYVNTGVRDAPSLLLRNRAAMLSRLLAISVELSSTIDCIINHSSLLPVVEQNAAVGLSGADAAQCISAERVYLFRVSLWTETE